MKGPGNNTLPALGTYAATLVWHGKSIKQLLYVLAAKMAPLLGFPAIQALGICTFVDNVWGLLSPQATIVSRSQPFPSTWDASRSLHHQAATQHHTSLVERTTAPSTLSP